METEAQAVAELAAEKKKLRKSLFRFDMIFFTVCAIVALDTIGQMEAHLVSRQYEGFVKGTRIRGRLGR